VRENVLSALYTKELGNAYGCDGRTPLTVSVASHTNTHWPDIKEPGAAACYEEQKSVVWPVR